MFTNSIVIVTWASLNFNMFTHLNSRHMSSAGPFWDDSMGWFPTNLPSTAKVRNIRWVQQRRTSEVSPGPLSRILPDIAGGSFLRGCEKNHGFDMCHTKPSTICPTLIWFSHWYTTSIPKTRGVIIWGLPVCLQAVFNPHVALGLGNFSSLPRFRTLNKKNRTLPFSDIFTVIPVINHLLCMV